MVPNLLLLRQMFYLTFNLLLQVNQNTFFALRYLVKNRLIIRAYACLALDVSSASGRSKNGASQSRHSYLPSRPALSACLHELATLLCNCDIHVDRKILFINETKWYKIWPRLQWVSMMPGAG
jgi:hypothetical protein